MEPVTQFAQQSACDGTVHHGHSRIRAALRPTENYVQGASDQFAALAAAGGDRQLKKSHAESGRAAVHRLRAQAGEDMCRSSLVSPASASGPKCEELSVSKCFPVCLESGPQVCAL